MILYNSEPSGAEQKYFWLAAQDEMWENDNRPTIPVRRKCIFGWLASKNSVHDLQNICQ